MTDRAVTASDPRLQLLPAGAKPRVWMFVLGVLLPCAAAGTALLVELQRGSGQAEAAILPVLILPAVTISCWFGITLLMRRHRLQLDSGSLEVVSSLYRTRTRLDTLRLDQARVVDVRERTELKPVFKTNGFSVPGFRSGWYRLRNGRRTFVAGVGEHRWLWLPTTGKHDLLLQPRDPQYLLQQLRELASPPRRR